MALNKGQENLLTAVLLLLCLGLGFANGYPRLTVQRVAIERVQPSLSVAISGAVSAPGVYELPWGSRVEDLVNRAGGFLAGAEGSLVNMAGQLDAGSSIFVPYSLTDGGDSRISLNSATQRELESLPGIGPAMSQRIIEARPFNSLDDLQNVRGIGPAIMERLRPLVKL